MRVSLSLFAAGVASDRVSFCMLPESKKASFLSRFEEEPPTKGGEKLPPGEEGPPEKTPPGADDEEEEKAPEPTIPYDGFWQVGCFADSTDEEKMVFSPKGQKVDPKQCFNFCRDQPGARFFGLIEGRRCYCTPYPTLGGGNGGCTRQCEGDGNFMCGGESMSTIYEMHRCGDVTEGAEKDLKAAKELLESWRFKAARAETVVTSLTEAGKLVDVSDVRKRVMSLASTLESLRLEVNSKVDGLQEQVDKLEKVVDDFDASAATGAAMKTVEDAQELVVGFSAVLSDSGDKFTTYMNEHDLDAAMAFRSIDSKALGSEEKLGADLSSDVGRLSSKAAKALKEVERDEKFTYLVEGKETIATLFQVYNSTSPIEGRPELSDAAQWKHWSVTECHQMCLMTPGCVGGNAIGYAGDEAYGMTCNLKGSVTRVEMSLKGTEKALLSGFLFGQYLQLHEKDIKFNTAAVLVG